MNERKQRCSSTLDQAMGRIAHTITLYNFTEPTNDQTPIPPPLPPLPAGKDGDWRRYFKERYLLDQNWSKGRHVQRSMYGHMDVILAVRVWGDYVVSGSRNGWVKCFDAGNGTEVWSAQMHSGGVSCIFTEGEVLYTGSWDATIKVCGGCLLSRVSFWT